jgi:hypothetical protein
VGSVEFPIARASGSICVRRDIGANVQYDCSRRYQTLAERKRSRFKPTAQPDREIDGFCEIELPAEMTSDPRQPIRF